jgi:ubiquinone/menaquinone biosynthesis C-methylase UbiE
MMGKNPFDDLAVTYDTEFTASLIGKAQRKIVWQFLQKRVFPDIEILEVNCGTGEDAFFLSGINCKVTATDESDEMIIRCQGKSQALKGDNNPVFRQGSINDLEVVTSEGKYDLIFSNFSGLNCIDPEELKKSGAKFHSLLKPDGRMILVVFGTKCLWEKFYFLLKGRRNEINRRSSKSPVSVQLLKSGIKIYYYSPGELRKLFESFFKVTRTKPIGLFIPPSYLNSFFMHKRIIFKILTLAERLASSFSFPADFSDHYLIEFRKL